jgi:hypothetical protein
MHGALNDSILAQAKSVVCSEGMCKRNRDR